MKAQFLRTIVAGSSAVLLASACTSSSEQVAADEPVVAAEATTAEVDGAAVSETEVTTADEAAVAGQEIEVKTEIQTREVDVAGVGELKQEKTELTIINVGPAMRYPLVDPADAGHPMMQPALMQEGGIVDLWRYEATGAVVAQAESTAAVIAAEPNVELAPELPGCNKAVTNESAGAVADPCMTQADFIASLNLSKAQLARLRKLGMTVVAH